MNIESLSSPEGFLRNASKVCPLCEAIFSLVDRNMTVEPIRIKLFRETSTMGLVNCFLTVESETKIQRSYVPVITEEG